MFTVPDCYLNQKRQLLQEFDDRLKTRPETVSKYDLQVLENKVNDMKSSIQTYFFGGLAGSAVVLANLRGLQGVSPLFKAFAVLAPPVLAPAYCYLVNIHKVQGFEAFLAIKYRDLDSAKH